MNYEHLRSYENILVSLMIRPLNLLFSQKRLKERIINDFFGCSFYEIVWETFNSKIVSLNNTY